jgi:hypothetical protein
MRHPCPKCGTEIKAGIKTRQNETGVWCIRSTNDCPMCKWGWESNEGCLSEPEKPDNKVITLTWEQARVAKEGIEHAIDRGLLDGEPGAYDVIFAIEEQMQ